MEGTTRRGAEQLTEASISEALSFLCRCTPLCCEQWTREGIRRARRTHFSLAPRNQLIFVYDVLYAVRDKETKALHLRVAGKLFNQC